RGSHAYLATYWAQELARQTEDEKLAKTFTSVAEALTAQESAINDELIGVQGHPADIGGYFRPDAEKTSGVMRPSATLNEVIDSIG
ncbi:MAG TPA: NADP-dependent isocitrate dehydrogenase, partial [Microthrixaceae bacterium]|nr:NADP-dependent isocitrate dehydrogenase [Microthrixaceae bacterium]